MAETGWLRSEAQANTFRVAGALFFVFGIFGILLPIGAPSNPPAIAVVSFVAFGLLLAIFGLLGLVWLPRMGCLPTEAGVLIRGFRRTKLVDWDDISQFSLGRAGWTPRVGLVHLRDGRVVRITGIQAPNVGSRANAEALIAALNLELGKHVANNPP